MDCTEVEKLQTPELVGSACTGRLFDGDIDEGNGDRVASKRKRWIVKLLLLFQVEIFAPMMRMLFFHRHPSAIETILLRLLSHIPKG